MKCGITGKDCLKLECQQYSNSRKSSSCMFRYMSGAFLYQHNTEVDRARFTIYLEEIHDGFSR